MTEREDPRYPAATGRRPATDDDWREQTTPGIPRVPVPGTPPYGSSGYPPPEADRTGYRSAAYQPRYEDGSSYGAPGIPAATEPAYSTRPLQRRRPDALAAVALLLAGIAAGISVLLRWLAGSEQTGWTLMRDGFREFGAIYRTGMWQPLAIILGGGLLFVLGLALLVPARGHRTLGLLALLVTAAVAAGVLVPLSAANWRLGMFDVGFFCGIAVAVLGLIGSLKALLTGPRVR